MLPRYKVAPELLNAGECPLLVQLEPPLCDSQHTLVDAETKLADEYDEERRDRDCRLSGREWAARQAARWVQAMQLLGAEVQSATSVIVSCRNEDMPEVAHQLASDQYVHWIDRHMPIKKRNYHAAYNNQASEMQVDVGAVWARGIDGSGEVIHTADSGVDVGHCMFHDSKVAVPYDKVDTTHRKVVAYWTGKTGDRYDAKLGHGTHVAATIAGSLEDRSNTASKYQGLAPGAKLAVSDFEIETATDEEGAMIFGDIFEEIYAKPLKEAGAAVQSHSWGTQEYTYTSRSAELDKFLNANREALFVWAAGNDGGSQAMQTVGSPATAKNCLSVGATLAGIDATVRLRDQKHTSIELGVGKQNLGFNKGQLTERADLWSNEHVLHLSARGPCKDGRIKPDIILPGLVQSAQSNGRLDNFNCCLNPKCWLDTKCLNDCSGHGQCDLTTAPDVYSCQCEAGYCGRDCSIKTDTPAINRCCPATAETLCTSSYNGFCKTGNTGLPSSFSYPACQCSGDSEGVSCQETRLSKLVTIPKMGTSMAAPVGAGLAALVRQYFRNGFYPSGMLNVADGFTPSGALLKAMLLTAAAQPRHGQLVQLYLDTLLDATDKDNSLMAQVTSDCKAVPGGPKGDAAKFCDTVNASMRGFPNGVQGFGRPLVEAVLYFSRPSQGGRYRPSPLNLFISDSLSASNGSVDSFCFYYESSVVKAALPLTATVTWMDPPASPAALQTLVNDLDLEVVDSCGMVLTGNSEVGEAPTSLPPNTPRDFFPTPPQRDSSGTLRDRVNNVERVILRDGGLGCGHMARTVRIRVRAHYVPVGPQPYALAVTSRNLPPLPANTTPRTCPLC
jgi:subtilisin family serine protease